MDLERITVGVDDSDGSRAALRWTADRATRRTSWIRLVHVVRRRGPDEAAAERVLSDARSVLARLAPATEVETILSAGDVAEALVEIAAADDLLVIGAHRDRILRSALHGWLPERIATRSTIPTVLVAEDWELHDGPVVVGVGVDGQDGAAVDFAVQEARRGTVSVDLLGAWRLPLPLGAARPVTILEDPGLSRRARRSSSPALPSGPGPPCPTSTCTAPWSRAVPPRCWRSGLGPPRSSSSAATTGRRSGAHCSARPPAGCCTTPARPCASSRTRPSPWSSTAPGSERCPS
ncbi:universal stress protein [Curtobacterium sp. VKM Ac-2865]|nr:universal stress protein [Curtobacterium sp. VKM Ac-2865]MBF4581938.1 universal stress protein [Curtobacterium sp. VKM Ac-2865]